MLTVVEKFLTSAEVATLRRRLESADWNDGKKTAGGMASNLKNNRQIDDQSELGIEIANFLLEKLGNHPTFISAAIPHRIYPPRINSYSKGETYGVHVDAPIMSMPHSNEVMRSDVSATIFLSDLNDYEGGELVIEGEFGAQEVKLDAGDMVVYPSSSLHQVTPVTRGERISAILWVQSMVAEVSARGLLFDLDQSIQSLTNSGKTDEEELMRLSAVYHNLVRRWVSL